MVKSSASPMGFKTQRISFLIGLIEFPLASPGANGQNPYLANNTKRASEQAT